MEAENTHVVNRWVEAWFDMDSDMKRNTLNKMSLQKMINVIYIS